MWSLVHTVLCASLTTNCCVIIYCVILRIQKSLASRCCCGQTSYMTQLAKAYEDNPESLAQICTEQIVFLVIATLGTIAVFASGVLMSPFYGPLPHMGCHFVFIILSMFIGKYMFSMFHVFLKFDRARISKKRVDLIHHVTTVVCYFVFVYFRENLLMALIGTTIELNMTVIQLGKFMKKVGLKGRPWYSRLSTVNCVVTIATRGIIPITFMAISMLRETPFMMSYGTITVFFISLIFFSVINVWLVLAAIQRVFKSEKDKNENNLQPPMRMRGFQRATVAIEKNNLGYLPPYDNRNLKGIENDKNNASKKDFSKVQIIPEFELELASGNKEPETGAASTGSSALGFSKVANSQYRSSTGSSKSSDSNSFASVLLYLTMEGGSSQDESDDRRTARYLRKKRTKHLNLTDENIRYVRTFKNTQGSNTQSDNNIPKKNTNQDSEQNGQVNTRQSFQLVYSRSQSHPAIHQVSRETRQSLREPDGSVHKPLVSNEISQRTSSCSEPAKPRNLEFDTKGENNILFPCAKNHNLSTTSLDMKKRVVSSNTCNSTVTVASAWKSNDLNVSSPNVFNSSSYSYENDDY